ncbi:hypothetical protein [Seleniivibrio woodruffii]|uniref:hypothetical protein n=1 Tax=Seleniivibrio woodruffii TaxID=1078050 RepID=UPI0026EFCFE8|nr:hypothetical protein [Seleniivibrio woodruffii]
MRMIQYLAAVILSFILVSCGGGTTTSKSKNSVLLKMDFENSGKSGRNGDSGFMVGNTLVTAVSISYSTAGGGTEEVDATEAAKNGTSVEIGDLIAGNTYSFIISANGENDEVVCTGSTDIEIVPNSATEAELACTFGGVASMELAALHMLETAYAGGASYDDIEKYVADDFGVMDGMGRDEFINHVMTQTAGFLFNNDVVLSGVVLTDVSEREKKDSQEGGLFDIKLSYSDGSFEYSTVGFANENGEWKIKGNGLSHDLELRNTSVRMYQYPGQTVPYVLSGLNVNYNINGSAGFNNFTVTAQGVSSAAFSLSMAATTWYGLTTANNKMALEYGSLPYYFSQPSYNIVPYNGSPMDMYETVNVEYGNSTEESYTVRGGNLSTEQYADMFPSLTMRIREDVNGPYFEFNVSGPAGYTPSGLRIAIDANNGITGYHIESKLSKEYPSFRYDDAMDLMDYSGNYFVVALTATDSNMRDYTVYYTFDYLMSLDNDGMVYSEAEEGSFKGFADGGFYSFLEYAFGVDNNEYGTYVETLSGLVNGDSLYTLAYYSGAGKITYGSLPGTPIVTRLTEDSAPVTKKLTFTNFSDGAIPSFSKIIKDSSGNIYLIADYTAGSSFVTVMKVKNDLSAIEWFKKYTLNSGSPTETVGGVVINQSGTDYLVLTLKDFSNGSWSLAKLSAVSGAAVSSKQLVFLDDLNNQMPMTPYGIVNIPSANRIALVGTSSGSTFYYGAIVYDYDMNFDKGFFRTDSNVDILPLEDIQTDSGGNIYFKYKLYDSSQGWYAVRVMKLNGSVTGAGYSIGSCSFVQINAVPEFDTPMGFDYDSSLAVDTDGSVYVLLGMKKYLSYDVFAQQGDFMMFKLNSDLLQTGAVRLPAFNGTNVIAASGYGPAIAGNRIAAMTSDLEMSGVVIDENVSGAGATAAETNSMSARTTFSSFTPSVSPDITDIREYTGAALVPVGVKMFNY